jgi:AraC-like DNA-binding protein
MLVINGNVGFQTEDFTMPLLPRTLVLLKPDQLHRPISCNLFTPYERYTLHVKSSILDSISTPSSKLVDAFNFSQISHYKMLAANEMQQLITLFDKTQSLIDSSDYFGKDILIRNSLSELLVLINRLFLKQDISLQDYSRVYSKLTSDVIRYINAHIREKISLEQLSIHTYVNKHYLSHIFKQETGKTIYKFILNKRLTYANKLLLDGESPSEVCFLCGFNDYSNFYRAFYNEYGISPREYQKKQCSNLLMFDIDNSFNR